MTSAKAISSYEVRYGKVLISTPYCDNVVETCRSWAGKFSAGKWVVPDSRLGDVQAKIGSDQDDLVEVEVGADECDGGKQLSIGWHVLAGRRARDTRADVYAELVRGEIPGRGGSAKNPLVAASSDARFRLWVPLDFAVTRKLTVVTDPRESAPSADATPERQRHIDPQIAAAADRLRSLIAAKRDDLVGRQHTEYSTARHRMLAQLADDYRNVYQILIDTEE